VVAAEFILATAGVGKRISFAYNDFDTRTMYALMLLIIAAVMLASAAFATLPPSVRTLERRR
jgi:NitT/TauT family transport system permease protein